MKTSTISERRWRRIFREQRTSGQSVAAFCRQAGVSQASFYVWRKRLRSAVGFVELKLSPDSVAPSRAIELRLRCGHCVVIPPGFDRSTLRELLATLESSNSSSDSQEADR